MGGIGSGHGTKRPDHPNASLWPEAIDTAVRRKQIYHQKSMFSDKLDPSLHAKKKQRERAAGIVDTPMDIVRKKQVALEARELQDLARRTAEKAFRALERVVDNPEAPPSAILTAANMILDRAYGKAAVTTFNINASMDAKPQELDDAGIATRINEALQRVERLAEGEGKTIEGTARPINLREYN